MLAIKRTLIPSPIYTYAAIAAASFVVTFGILSVAKPQFGNDQIATDSSRIAKESGGSRSNASAVKLGQSSSTSSPDTSAVNKPQQSTTTNVQPTATPSPPTVNPTVATNEPSTILPASADSLSQPTIPAESTPTPVTITQPPAQQDSSLVGGLLGGLGGVVDALL